MPQRATEGPIQRTAWRFTGEQTSAQVYNSLIGQLQDADFTVLLDCVSADCGGYDFLFSLPIVGPPGMYVDLREFRYIAAHPQGTGQQSFISFLISRSPQAVYLQSTQYGFAQEALANAPVLNPTPQVADTSSAAFHWVLEGLDFAPGRSNLKDDRAGDLQKLAQYLAQNPERRALLVGHSDMSGKLGANIALSKARAEAVKQALVTNFSVPADRLSAHGVGPLSPRAGNETDADKERNRRVEVVFY